MTIIYPSFYSLYTNAGEELIFLDDGAKLPSLTDKNGTLIGDFNNEDKTQNEAFINHYHLFEKVGEKGRLDAIRVGTAVAENLLSSLVCTYPDKKFIVYLEVNEKDSTIVRFHQLWDNEPLYLDLSQVRQEGLSIFEFRS